MKGLLLSASLFLMAGAVVAGEMTDAEREVMKARQALTEKFGAAVANKNVAALVTELYTEDAVLQSLCPEFSLAFGRDGYLKRLEGAVKNSGFRDYSAKVKEAHLLGNDRAWTTGDYAFTVNGKDDKPEQAHGNWLDMLRRERNGWKVMFQAYARTPCE